MAETIGKENTNQKVMPIIEELFKDENSEVKINVVNGLIKIAKVIGTDLMIKGKQIIEGLTTITKEGQWRVRMAAFELVADLSLLFGLDVYMKNFHVIFMSYI
jgi:serine/threonine-protein phosphatase 2A regulatory subunit A